MGMYSSWAMFTFTHHLIVFRAIKEAGKEYRPGLYVVLGDDIVIADDDVAFQYKKIMMELDVEISPSKTHTSKWMYEFAKRWLYEGREVSPFPIPALISSKDRYYLLADVLKMAWNKGFNPPDLMHPGRYFLDLTLALGLPKRLATYVATKLHSLILIPDSSKIQKGDLVDRARTFLTINNVLDSCSWSDTTVTKLFIVASAEALTAISEEEETRIQNQIAEYENTLMSSLESVVSGQDDQSWLSELMELFPPVSSLIFKIQRLMESREEHDELENILTFWPNNVNSEDDIVTQLFDKVCRLEVTPLPRLSGIIPERLRDKALGSRSHWMNRVL